MNFLRYPYRKPYVCCFLSICLLLLGLIGICQAQTGQWRSKVTGSAITYTITEPKVPVTDFDGNYSTIIYLEKLGFEKIGGNKIKKDIKWLLARGYRVIELNYERHPNTISPWINEDIIAINDALEAGNFCGLKDCSLTQSFILFEGYRIARNVPYFKDDPSVYNHPDNYTEGDTLHMDIIYPANATEEVPVILSFSYSNSYATYDKEKGKLTNANKNKRMFLPYTLAGFNDSFLEGAPAAGMAWAIADHPKYCPWGSGKPAGGPNNAYKSFQANPDAVQKVKSAVRTLRAMGGKLGFSGNIGIYGFSRGSTAGSLAIGNRRVAAFENSGFYIGISDEVQAAVLGPGVFDYTQIYNTIDDGDANLENRCPLVWGPLESDYPLWESMGASYLVTSSSTAPVFFFYNTDDDLYYADQVNRFRSKLDALGVSTHLLKDYSSGHAVPQTGEELSQLYSFFRKHMIFPKTSPK